MTWQHKDDKETKERFKGNKSIIFEVTKDDEIHIDLDDLSSSSSSVSEGSLADTVNDLDISQLNAQIKEQNDAKIKNENKLLNSVKNYVITKEKFLEIKQLIGAAFLDILKKATIRIILQKEPFERRDDEIDRVIALLKTFEFLNKNKKLSYVYYRELAISMTYKEIQKGDFVYQIDHEADKVFVVLNGQA